MFREDFFEISDIEREHGIYRRLKSCSKIFNRCRSKFIPPTKRQALAQLVANFTLYSLPNHVDVLELVPERIYASRIESGVSNEEVNVWGVDELNNYMHTIIKQKHPNVGDRRLKKYFTDNFPEDFVEDKGMELQSYERLAKSCKNSPLPVEYKDAIYVELASASINLCPQYVKEFKISDEISFVREDVESGVAWSMHDLKEYMKDSDE